MTMTPRFVVAMALWTGIGCAPMGCGTDAKVGAAIAASGDKSEDLGDGEVGFSGDASTFDVHDEGNVQEAGPVDSGPVVDLGEPSGEVVTLDAGPTDAPSVKADAVEVSSEAIACATYAASLPIADTPCDVKGAVRCTGLDAKLMKPKWAGEIVGANCVMPYRVVCTKVGSTLVWKLDACGPLPDECATPPELNSGLSCQENSRGTTCCPLACASDPNGIRLRASDGGLEGTTACVNQPPSSSTRVGVSFPDLPVKNFLDSPDGYLSLLGKCGPYCKNGVYELTVEVCPQFAWFDPSTSQHVQRAHCATRMDGSTVCAKNKDDYNTFKTLEAQNGGKIP